MQWLPPIVAGGAALVLPVAGGTVGRVAAALVAGDDEGRADRSLLADALSRDAALTLWTITRAQQSGSPPLRDAGALAQWLSSQAIDLWCQPAHTRAAEAIAHHPSGDESGGGGEIWAALAARSTGVATLAAEIARQQGLDEQAAHTLGLLHLAPQWLASAGDDSNPPLHLLPRWLRAELDGINAADPDEIVSAAACVRAAMQCSDADGSAETLPEGLTFDRQIIDTRIAATRDDWIVPAAENLLCGLASRLRRLRELEGNFAERLEAEKLESLKELAYGAGHEINNPLANISARAQALLSDERDLERRRMLASINAQAFRAHEMIADMMLFARPPRANPEPLDLVELLTTLQAELDERAAPQQTQIVLHAPHAPIRVVADKAQIAVALRSLCINALEALVTGGRVDISLDRAAADAGVRITVADDGPGIPADVRPHIFDPFYSGREAGRGLGLGLSKCWRIVTMHQGRLEVDSPHGHGAVFTVTLPAGDAP